MHAIDYLAQAYWHGFVYRSARWPASTGRAAWCRWRRSSTTEGRQVTPRAGDRLRHARHRHRQPDQRLRHARRQGARHRAGDGGGGRALPQPPGQRLHPRQHPDRAAAAGAAAGRHHRRRRDGDGAGGRAAQDHAPARRLRARSHRSGQGHQDQPDRGRAAHPAAAARAAGEGGGQAARRPQGARAYGSAGRRGAGGRRAARQRHAHSGRAGGVGGRREGAGCAGRHRRAGDQPAQPAGGAGTLQTTRDDDIFAIGDCAACPWPGHDHPVPPRAQAAHQQASHLAKQLPRRIAGEPLAEWRYRDFGSLVSLGHYSTVGSLMGKLIGGNLFIEGVFAGLMYKSLYKMHQLALHGAHQGVARHPRPADHAPHRAAREAALRLSARADSLMPASPRTMRSPASMRLAPPAAVCPAREEGNLSKGRRLAGLPSTPPRDAGPLDHSSRSGSGLKPRIF